jgi:rhodanese-related sulfurtransferase
VKEPWDQNSGYDVEIAANKPAESFPPSIITSQQDDARSIIKDRAKKYLSGEGSPVIISSDVKAIVDDWDHKKAQFQIVDVRSEREYHTGHVPYSIHIPWMEIADNENLKKLDPNKTIITYSENGQTGQAVTTLLNLLGYSAVNMKFGMMDWNKACVDKHHLWNGAPGYPVEFSVQNVELNR